MGSSGSKINNSEAVTLCRGRSNCLSRAIDFRYAFSDAHVAYIMSLKSVSESLNQFMDGIDTMCNVGSVNPQFPSAQKDELGSEQKGEELDSDLGSHINFPPDSDLSDCGSDDKTDEPISRVQHHLYSGRNQPTSSSSYFLPPYVAEGNIAHPYSSSSDHGHTYSYDDNYGYLSNYYGFYGESSDHPVTKREVTNVALPPELSYDNELTGGYFGFYPHHVTMHVERCAAPPPFAPGNSNCEFYGMNHVNYSVPTRDWNELREEEGIPDLEDVEDSAYASSSMDDEINEESDEAVDGDGHTSDDISIDVREKIDNDINLGTVNNNVTSDVEERTEEKNEAMLRIKCYNTLSKVAAAVKSQFDKASESAAELSEIIEVGKRWYHQKTSGHKSGKKKIVACIGFEVQAFFKTVINSARSRLSSKNRLSVAKEEVDTRFCLSSTLQKLIIWETKLYDEVMEEEKTGFAYGKKCKEMRGLIERSAEQQKLDPVMPVLKKLSVQIKLSIQVIDFISTNIAVLRDEILFPQVCQLIKGLAKMWSSMYECYKTLHRAIPEENFLQSFSCGDKSCSDAQLETTKKLGLELIEWTIKFSTWINAQKDFIKALNDWLLIAVCYAKEETADGVAPFSPSRLGAPSIFVICNQWDQTIHRISEKEVIVSMQSFSSSVLSLWKKQKAEQRQNLLVNEDMEKEIKIIEKEEKEMRRIVKARSKKLTRVSGQNGIVMSEENAEESNLHVGLLRMFESMENYCAVNVKVYDELNIRIEEENERVD